MSQFNKNEYEIVKERKAKFYKDHEDGRIVVSLLNTENPLDYALFEASIYFDKEDQEKGLKRATGYALEIRDKELSISNTGKKYESVNYTSWTENCEESAVGRALDNAGYSGNKKCSREEIEKSQRMSKTINANSDKEAQDAGLWCDYHKCKMFQTKNMKSPAHKDEKRGWCNGKGYKDEIDAWKKKTKAESRTVKPKDEYDQSIENIEDSIPF